MAVLAVVVAAIVSFLKPVADAFVEPVGAALKRKYNYLCYFTTNMEDMKDEADTLEEATKGVQREVEREMQNAQDIVSAVETWLRKSNSFKGKADGILNQVPIVKNGCFGITARYSLSRKAMKIDEAMKKHRAKMEFDRIARPKPTVSMVLIPSAEATNVFLSRREIEDKIMTSLKEKEMIGICGMGGLGKTFMANKIRNRTLEEHVFDEVVMAVVSQQVDECKIQLQIAEQLGLILEEQTLLPRAKRIRERLNDSKRTLLILDDVWECLKLVDLGIPCDSEGCRILFTSRNSDALSRMNVGKVFGMEVLSEEEAWILFKGKAGTCVDDIKLNSIAKRVVKECKGLPIALIIVGAAMKHELDERIWKDSAKQLMKANPENIPNFIEEVYNPLEVSYTKLASEEAKSVFLLCCLFPEDADISVERLTYFCMGLFIFKDVKSLEGARNRMHALVKMLKNRSLLQDSNRTHCVRMHDVVRDVCRFIAKQKGYIDGNECQWISSSFEASDQLPKGLRLLILRCNSLNEERKFTISKIDTFFKEMRDLYVLSMEMSLTPTPTPTQSQKNLRTLILMSCHSLRTISFVGDLVNLEILCCQDCSWIEELPMEIRNLKCLKLLDLTGCTRLRSIGRGIISSLVRLEELKMLGSFARWEAEDREDKKNAGLRELESLANLKWLEIEVEDLALAAENMHLSSKLERFQIYIPLRIKDSLENNVLELQWLDGTCLGNWIQMQLLRDTQRLVLSGTGVNNVELAKIPNDIYTSLFTNLSTFEIGRCPNLHNLGQLSIAGNDCFPNLENLKIFDCAVMKQVFLWNHHLTKKFPKLKKVDLCDLPNLTTFSQGIEGIEFPLLVNMYIFNCPKMTGLNSSSRLIGVGSNLDNSGGISSVDGHEKVSFGSLKNLSIVRGANENLLHSLKSSFNGLENLSIGYLNSMSLFTSSIVESLVCLKKLHIHDCHEMLGVIQEDDEEEIHVSGYERRIHVFPNLQKLELINLRKLVTFCESTCDIEFPSLTSVEITRCPNMKTFTPGHLIAPNWKSLKTDLKHPHEVSSMKMKKFEVTDPYYSLRHYIKISEPFFICMDKLSISNYKGRVSLFSCAIVRNLINLRDLCIDYSHGIKQVIEDGGCDNEETSLFPKLEKLKLDSLYGLVTFCEWSRDVELASLKIVDIKDCRKMSNMTLGSLTTPILANIIIDYEIVGASKDLNALLQQAKKAKEEEDEENKKMDTVTNYWMFK